MSLEGPNTPGSAPPDPEYEIRFFIQDRFVFKLVFKAKRTRKTVPKALKKQQKSIPKFIKNDFHEKSFFAIRSMGKPRFGSPKRRNFDSEIDKKMTWKQARNKNDFLTSLNPKN